MCLKLGCLTATPPIEDDIMVLREIGKPLFILAMAPNKWDGPWMNRQQLLSRLVKLGHTVYYSTGQWFTWDRFNPKWKCAKIAGKFVEKEGVRVDQAAKILMRCPRYPFIDKYSITMAALRLRLALNADKNYLILHIFHPDYSVYVKHFPSSKLVYHAYDLFELTPDFSTRQLEQENELILKADMCLASSNSIAQRLAERTGKAFRVLPNGADTDAFYEAVKHSSIADDIAEISQPRIGYVGRINRKIDLGLIVRLAQNNTKWNFVMVGPVLSLDNETQRAWQACQNLTNVYFLGEKRHTQLPNYVAGLDVALMPYRMGTGLWTDAIYPLKLHEYLAADKPVVSSPIASVLPFDDVIELASSLDEWTRKIRKGLSDEGIDDSGARVKVARANDWNIRAEQLHQLYQELICK